MSTQKVNLFFTKGIPFALKFYIWKQIKTIRYDT